VDPNSHPGIAGTASSQVTGPNMSELDDLLVNLTSGDELRAESAIQPLLDLGEEAIPGLLDLLQVDDPDQRWWAVRVLSQSHHARVEWLLPVLNDPDVEVRQAAALGLGSHPCEAAIDPLIQALGDPDSMLATLAMHALVANGKNAVPALLAVPSDAPLSVRIHVIRALAEIQDHRAIPALMSALEEDSALLQHWAEEGLDRLGLNMVYLKPE
jgi:HEAT repeat protein